MKQFNRKLIAMAAAMALTCAGAPVMAGMPVNTLTGTVTSVTATQIVIDGTTYSVPVQSPALHELEQVRPGEQVDVILSGPLGAPSTQVVDIHVRSNH